MRRDIHKIGVVGEWRELAEDRGGWRSNLVKAGQKLGAIGPHPYQGKRRRRRSAASSLDAQHLENKAQTNSVG